MRNRKTSEALSILDDARSTKFSRNGERNDEWTKVFRKTFRPYSVRQNRRTRRLTKMALQALREAV